MIQTYYTESSASINQWIKNHPDAKIIDIKFQVTPCDSRTYSNYLIIFEVD